MFKYFIFFLVCTITSSADIVQKNWKPANLSKNDQIRSIHAEQQKIFFITTSKELDSATLHIASIKDLNKITVIASKKLSSLTRKYHHYFGQNCKMLFKNNYLYIVPPGGYETSILVFELKENIHFIKEIALFSDRAKIHYVEMPKSLVASEQYLFVQLERGLSILDISNVRKPTIIKELDNIQFIATQKDHLYYGFKNDLLVFYTDNFINNMHIPTYENVGNTSFSQLSFIGQSKGNALFSTQKESKSTANYSLQILSLDNNKHQKPNINIHGWDWQEEISQGSLELPYLALQRKDTINIYKLTDQKPNLITSFQQNGIFTLHQKTLFVCNAEKGIIVIRGWR
ncbi:hypothetical protein [Candidatus Uabimicrobium sp. HlEnr_7]|uniref:hypothetical protein n=1 Tax=Candidatus Uabimicrobium helgolandensis TaxID=3095367 RepID=UPI0035584719